MLGRELTPREKQIVSLLVKGYISNKAIASRLGISPATVKVYFQFIYTKLGLHSRVAVAIWGVRNDYPLADHRIGSYRPHPALGSGWASYNGERRSVSQH